MDFSSLRNYLGGPIRPSARDVMLDAVVFRVPGAVILFRMILEMRVNRRNTNQFTYAFSLNQFNFKMLETEYCHSSIEF